MNCPKCGKPLVKMNQSNNSNYVRSIRKCKKCKFKTNSYEFLAEDLPNGYLQEGTRVLIGDNLKDIIPALFLRTSNNSLYPYIVLDNDGEMQGKTIIKIAWGAKEL